MQEQPKMTPQVNENMRDVTRIVLPAVATVAEAQDLVKPDRRAMENGGLPKVSDAFRMT